MVTRFWCPATVTQNEVLSRLRLPNPESAQARLISAMEVLRVDVIVDDDLAVFGWTCRDVTGSPSLYDRPPRRLGPLLGRLTGPHAAPFAFAGPSLNGTQREVR